MHHNSHQFQFFMSTDGDCPYLSDQRERKLFTTLSDENAKFVQNALSHQGYRRSQNILYRPVCQNCAACLSARIKVSEFQPSRNQKRILNKNKDVVREVRMANATEEQFELFQRYVGSRHQDGGMSDMTIYDFAAMIDQTNVPTRVVEYRLMGEYGPDKLIAANLCDVLDDGLSMVYSFFDPECTARSLGSYMILDHIDLSRRSHLDYVYLGYWVKNSPNMGYKARYKPLEVYFNDQWRDFDEIKEAEPDLPNSQKVLLQTYRAMRNNNS